jgi:hypothetical protein
VKDPDRLRVDLWYIDEVVVEEAVTTPGAVMIEIRFADGEGPGARPLPLPENSPTHWRMN